MGPKMVLLGNDIVPLVMMYIVRKWIFNTFNIQRTQRACIYSFHSLVLQKRNLCTYLHLGGVYICHLPTVSVPYAYKYFAFKFCVVKL